MSYLLLLAGSMSLPTAGRSVRRVTIAYTGARFPTAGKYAKGFPRTRGDRPSYGQEAARA